MSKITNESFVTLATNDNYALGALTLGASLKSVNTNRMLTVMISTGVSPSLQAHLKHIFDHVHIVDVLNSQDTVNLALLKRPELGVTFTKLNCWRMEQFSKCVFLDADCLVLKNVDELFDREEFSAATDVGWPDCFNSGVFVYKPSAETYSKLVKFATTEGSFDGGDQGLLNSYFAEWSTSESSRRLPFIYNMTTNVSYSYAPALKKFADNVKIVHFIGAQKPWYFRYNLDTNTVAGVSSAEAQFLNTWWSTFATSILPCLNSEMKDKMSTQLITGGSGAAPVAQTQGWNQTAGPHHDSTPYTTGAVSSGGVVVGSDQHQKQWESGKVEYKGRDSFSNIQAHLDTQIKK